MFSSRQFNYLSKSFSETREILTLSNHKNLQLKQECYSTVKLISFNSSMNIYPSDNS